MERRAMFGTFENKTRGTVVASWVESTSNLVDRLLGLLFRSRLRPKEGLWVVPCRLIHTVGMRYAIDAIYLDRNLVVVAVQENLRPFRLGRVARLTHSILEVSSGRIAASGTAVGDQLVYISGPDVKPRRLFRSKL